MLFHERGDCIMQIPHGVRAKGFPKGRIDGEDHDDGSRAVAFAKLEVVFKNRRYVVRSRRQADQDELNRLGRDVFKNSLRRQKAVTQSLIRGGQIDTFAGNAIQVQPDSRALVARGKKVRAAQFRRQIGIQLLHDNTSEIYF